MTSLEEIVASFKKKRLQIEEEIKEKSQDKQRLEQFNDKISRLDECFDEYDRAAVQKEIEICDQDLIALKTKLNAQVERQIEEERILQELGNVIHQRMEFLEKDDETNQLLESHPQLLKFMVQKQLSLQDIIDNKLQKLKEIT